jgi:peptidoglycan-associated lipoprotein
MHRNAIFVGLTASLLVVAPIACKKKPPTTAADHAPAATSGSAPVDVKPPAATAPRTDQTQDVLSEDLATLNKKGYLHDAYFDYDASSLRDDARTALSTDAQWLKKYPSMKILLEGHCDDRGTEAYNLSLGERRANATREYLDSLGIAPSRVETVSYGKEKPFCEDETDVCRQDNRRAHFLVVAK